jgi:hypothetical protein
MSSFSFPVSMNPGTSSFGPVTIADDLNTLKVALANWTGVQASRTLAFDIWISFDGGATWNYQVGMNPTPGGRVADPRFPATGTDCSVIVGPMALGTNRQLRADLTVVGGKIDTLLTITTS